MKFKLKFKLKFFSLNSNLELNLIFILSKCFTFSEHFKNIENEINLNKLLNYYSLSDNLKFKMNLFLLWKLLNFP